MPESPADKALFDQSKTRMPLNGITVLDLTLARAGPTAVRHFADWGANVIRIEPPASEGEDVAGRRHGFDFQNLHRNKRAITLNLKTPEGHAAFMRLAKTADVVLENMRAAVKHRLKVSYDDVKAVNPRIVYGSISGFGQDGPYGPRAGVDQIAQGMGGLMSITGLPGQGPVRVGIPIDDLTAGNLLALGCMMALYDRERTGVGRWVTTSLLEAQIFMLDFQGSRWLIEKEVAGSGRQRSSDRHSDRRVPDQRRAHQYRRQLVPGVHPVLRGDRQAGVAAGPGMENPGRPQQASQGNQCRDRRDHQNEAGRALDRADGGQRHSVRADLHDRSGVRRSAGETSRHGDEDGQPVYRGDRGRCVGDQHFRLLEGDPAVYARRGRASGRNHEVGRLHRRRNRRDARKGSDLRCSRKLARPNTPAARCWRRAMAASG
jgi:hypothetical protein